MSQISQTPESSVTPAIEARALAKTFRVGFWMTRKVEALRGLDLTVRRGEIFGFLGPNGAGKSTTIKILTGLIHPDAGSATLFGRPPTSPEARRLLGYLPENPVFYDHLSGRELLEYYGRLLHLSRAARVAAIGNLLDQVGLAHAATMQVRRYSKGMVQRLGIAQALLQNPDLVILDEPTSGLDPAGRHDVRELMLRLKSRGKTVFFSTHIIPDVETVCDRVGILVAGKLVRLGTVQELLSTGVGAIEVTVRGVPPAAREALSANASSMREVGGDVSMVVADDATVEELIRKAWKLGGRLVAVQPQRFSLEQLVLDEMGARASEPHGKSAKTP